MLCCKFLILVTICVTSENRNITNNIYSLIVWLIRENISNIMNSRTFTTEFVVLYLVCTFCIVIILVLVWSLYAQMFVIKQEK